ncbi:hypothetical protein Y032_0001g32 [Ancylostoma ceylanicum]|uniref:Uncharacterized protein n=1 Tax=Ancylostoma ceylanicum TaxID=53326 RepID=A0A016W3K9_9BILA|nr:hypothetical protein Y032_0001g32 [Ancylostoma ceylanicum]
MVGKLWSHHGFFKHSGPTMEVITMVGERWGKWGGNRNRGITEGKWWAHRQLGVHRGITMSSPWHKRSEYYHASDSLSSLP